jgi:sulfur carrier protein
MKIMINGAAAEVPADAHLADAVARVAADRRDVAVALNGEVVRRGDWETTEVADGDRVEVLTAVQGG